MKIVIDTNIVISGIFFGGLPRKILEAAADGKIQAIASNEILEEYEKVFETMVKKKNGNLNKNILYPFISRILLVDPKIKTDLCRDKDDNKFLDCAIESDADYIISGDDDLLSLENISDIPILSARSFLCLHQNYL